MQVIWDGRLVGYIDPKTAIDFVDKIREAKVMQTHPKIISKYTSVTHIPNTPHPKATQMAGIYIYSSIARTLRPVTNLVLGKTEWIDPLEQSYMSIACNIEDIREDTTHQEIHPDLILSELAT